MIIKALILSAFLTNEPIIVATPSVEIEVSRKRGKNNKGRRRGGHGLR